MQVRSLLPPLFFQICKLFTRIFGITSKLAYISSMKATVSNEARVFQPKQLNITIESNMELRFLWSLFNQSTINMMDIVNKSGKIRGYVFEKDDVRCSTRIWNALELSGSV